MLNRIIHYYIGALNGFYYFYVSHEPERFIIKRLLIKGGAICQRVGLRN
jgi:hypothetical protein